MGAFSRLQVRLYVTPVMFMPQPPSIIADRKLEAVCERTLGAWTRATPASAANSDCESATARAWGSTAAAAALAMALVSKSVTSSSRAYLAA